MSKVSKKYATSSIGYKIIKKYSSDDETSSDEQSSSDDETSFYSDSESEYDTRQIKYNKVKNKLSNKNVSDKNASNKNVSKKNVSKPPTSRNNYISIANSEYKKPKSGTKQDFLTKDEIRQKLKGYKALRTMEDKTHLFKLRPFNVWIRYFNTVTNEFRLGGLLQKVDPQLRYITLVNTSQHISWSVQLKDNIIFVPINHDKKYEEKQQKKQEKIKEKEKKEKEIIIKEKLYKLYMNGKLTKK
jgi:hypothetical protein